MINYKNKYLKYKKKYLNLKHKQLIGGYNNKNKLTKKSNNFENNFTSNSAKNNILKGINYILIELQQYINNNNIDTIISIGDSPSIILNIYKLFHQKYNLNYPNIFYFPISNLKKIKLNKLKKNLKNLDNQKKIKGNIMWIDYVNTGMGFYNFYNSIPKIILKKSKFFIYGDYTKNNIKEFINKNKNKINHLIFNPKSYISNFLKWHLGDSELYNIRCVEKNDCTKNNFKIKIIKNIPTKNSKFNKYCIKISKYYFDIISKKEYF
jgi:hypothetical protein